MEVIWSTYSNKMSSRPIRRSPRMYDFSVYRTEEITSNHTSTSSDHQFSIQQRIKTALNALESSLFFLDVLVQFWAAKTDDDGRRLLTTSDQPFVLNCLTNKKLNQYKKNSPSNKFVDDGEEEEHNQTGGFVSRVSRRQLPEMSLDMSCYTIKEYPELELALECGFKTAFALPVFEPSLERCVGVLEFLFGTSLSFEYCATRAVTALQVAGLETVNPWQLRKHVNLFEEELKRAMVQVCKTHGLPFADIWARCEHIRSKGCGGSLNMSYSDSDVNCRGEFLVSIHGMQVYDIMSFGYNDFNVSTFTLPLRVGQGPVGKVFRSDKPCFCRDVTQLSIIDYPIAHFVRRSRFKSCFAVCLQSVATRNRIFAVEFFLPPNNKIHNRDLHNFLSSILTTLKQHLKSFEVVAGDIGNDFFTEIDNLTESNVEASMVKEKNVIHAEKGNTSFTQNTLNTSSGHHETPSVSTEFTSFHTISSLNTYSGHETVSSSREFTSLETISVSALGERCTEGEDSAQSLRSMSVESTLNGTPNQSYLDRSTSMNYDK